ncbi:helix-turn-helix domain-containing protein [Propioniciclava coleopterorum]|uniref:Helix-turn-helix domain-containing protein n=1 Tax=Propioniciclava coleopterorum TaxID=2714937 RepID=A0A6G7Y9B3_9ACTN|nr:TOBE domain-containing protein [Propioniciclava coleopterorum]QIK73484.1 helix-turn-helix domain-containing protein [Propioniciclava coleopterorum]
MTQIRIRDAAELLGVSDDTVRRWIDEGRLDAASDAAGRRVVDGVSLAALAQERATAPGTPDRRMSARNRLAGLVTKVTSDPVMSQVELQCGPFRVVSLLSTEAVQELGLAPGVVAAASVKATNVVVERLDQ